MNHIHNIFKSIFYFTWQNWTSIQENGSSSFPYEKQQFNIQVGEKKSVPFSEFVPVSSPCAMKVTCTFIHPLSSDIFQGIPCVQCSCLEHYMSLAHPSGQYTTLLSSSIQRHALQFERRLKAQ